jgi:hypothetical protein
MFFALCSRCACVHAYTGAKSHTRHEVSGRIIIACTRKNMGGRSVPGRQLHPSRACRTVASLASCLTPPARCLDVPFDQPGVCVMRVSQCVGAGKKMQSKHVRSVLLCSMWHDGLYAGITYAGLMHEVVSQ